MSEQADKIWHAVLSCPHTIMHDEIAIRVSHKRDGNAARQTYDRIETAINALIEEQAARIEQLEQKLRTTSLEALSISDTNNEMAVRIAELEDEDSKFEAEWTEARKGVNYFDMAHILSGRLRQMDKRAKAANKRADASQARLSEAVKVLEGLLDVTESDNTPNDIIRFSRSRIQAFITTLGGEKE